MADACIHIMNLELEEYKKYTKDNESHINVGSGIDISIIDLAYEIANTVGYVGNIEFDITKPDGTMRKLMDSSKLNNMGWHHKINLRRGLNYI